MAIKLRQSLLIKPLVKPGTLASSYVCSELTTQEVSQFSRNTRVRGHMALSCADLLTSCQLLRTGVMRGTSLIGQLNIIISSVLLIRIPENIL